MSRLSHRESSERPARGERVFTDADGRQWTAASQTSDGSFTVVFSCISEGRVSGRAILIEPAVELGDVDEDTLRAWLEAAPRIGRLT